MNSGEEPTARRRLRAFGDDDIVRFTMSPDVPIVGLVRNREEYREMREIALIYGMTLGLSGKTTGAPKGPLPEAGAGPTPGDESGDEIPVRVRGRERPHPANS